MKLDVKERLTLLQILPREGDITTIKIVRDLRETLSFTEEEHKALEISMDNKEIHWNVAADVPREIQIGNKAQSIICDRLKELDSQKKLSEQHISLYEKFVEE